ncbi:hypothetical protein CRG98_040519, partial [Punica granatum]
MEDKSNDQEEIQTLSSDSLIESDDDGSLSSEKAEENDDKLHPQEPLTDQEIEDLIAEYLDVESKAAEAQEALEKESLAKLESEVREELAQSLTGDELEKAVADEMDTYKEEWEAALDELETESAHLLEQLDGAGIELPSLFKWIESQAPNNCSTEAWKKRTHWVGSQVTGEVTESVAEAEKHLQIIRPLRRKHGRVLEEGASGFLQKKIASEESKEDIADNPTVEEIDDIDANLNDPFVADAIANEREMVLSEVQKGNFKKVKEEEDANLDRKLQLHLKRRRHKRRLKQVQDSECSECYCGWCGRSSELVNCKSCNQLFCTTCIERNLGEEFLSKVQTFGWQCCCCTPSVLKSLTLELDEAMRSEFAELSSSGSDSDTSDSGIDAETRSKKKHKRKIRRILDDAELGEETKRKIAIEKERQERLRSLQQQFSAKSTAVNSTISDWRALEGAGIDVLGDAIRGYIVNVVRERDEVAIRVPPSISAKLKTHQVTGIRFIWENIVQSIGKVIAFLYTAMRCVDLGLRTALIVTPVNVLHNWRHEFTKWAPSEFKPIRTFMLEDVSRERRVELLAKWRRKGGVFLISYTAFRNLSVGKNIKDRNVARDIISALQDGPDILVCDEAHIIKNTRADTTQALKLVKCQRRIALTGSPLQNNLMEYYCMVDFVREGFLGSSHEFRNRFQNPIENGQHTNSTSEDVKIMNQRSHILYEQLKGFVQRMDMSVVKKDLPPKTVFVIAVKLSPLQRKLYKKFLDVHGFTRGRVYSENIGKRSFFAGYQALAQIWNHPGILQLRKEDRDYVRREDAVENFLVDDSSSDENVDFNGINKEKPSATDNNGFFRK